MSETNINRTPYGFIPSPLAIPDKPELSVFPFNIMFMSFANIDGIDSTGQTLYLPDLESHTKNSKSECMRYFNQCQNINGNHIKTTTRPASYVGQDYIDISYFEDSSKYEAEKYVGGQNISTTHGNNWKVFFIHLTLPGLAKNEGCEFEPIKQS